MSVALNGIGNQSHCISKEWQAGEMNRRSAVVVFTVSTIKLKNISKQEVHIVNKASMKTILLIEDTSDILENLTEYLEMEGYSVLVANNGKKGIELAVEFTPVGTYR
jgi:PleD family two-component response regulator